jgi:3-(3-hydroxy-phenyl)propionate hydroxylase
VLESQPHAGSLSRASTFHPPTLDLLDRLGVGSALVAAGRPARRMQYRDRVLGILAEFDMSLLDDITRHPYRLQVEQRQLTALMADALTRQPAAEARYSARVTDVRQADDRVHVFVAGETEQVTARYVVGADGAHSVVRASAGVEFTGATYEMRYLTVTSPLQFDRVVTDLAPVTYVSGGVEGVGLLALRTHWRAVFRIPRDESDDEATSAQSLQSRLRGALGAPQLDVAVDDAFIYRVHRRLASTFRIGRVLLVGDAAHLNSPSGGMGMNSGIHDAFVAAEALARVVRLGVADDVLTTYAEQRRAVARDVVGERSDRNYRDIIEPDLDTRRARGAELARTAADPQAARRYLLKASMFDTAPMVTGAGA